MGSFAAILLTLLVFTVLVTIHELGHFVMAKKSGILVKEFAIGMGPAIFKKQFGETLYSIRILPLGGYCAMLGEDDDNDPRSFASKSILARFMTLFMGPAMNFLLAFLILFGLVGTSYMSTTNISGVLDNSAAQAAGLVEGDKIISINGKKINVTFDIREAMAGYDGKTTDIVVLRDGEKMTFKITPILDEETGSYMLGVYNQVKAGVFSQASEEYEKASIIETVKQSYYSMAFYVKSTIQGFVRIITLNVGSDELTGPIGIVQVVEDSYTAGLEYSPSVAIRNVLSLAALLSANLGAINLFPIPALDGGRIFFLLIEAVRGKPLSREKEGIAHFVGFVLLIGLMVFVAYNDIIKLF